MLTLLLTFTLASVVGVNRHCLSPLCNFTDLVYRLFATLQTLSLARVSLQLTSFDIDSLIKSLIL